MCWCWRRGEALGAARLHVVTSVGLLGGGHLEDRGGELLPLGFAVTTLLVFEIPTLPGLGVLWLSCCVVRFLLLVQI